MVKLEAALSFGGILSKKDIAYCLSYFNKKQLKANEHFHQLHHIANEIGFINEGIFRIYTADALGNDITKHFVQENQFMVDLASYYTANPGTDGIQAMVPSEIFSIHKSALNHLIETIPSFYIFLKSISEAHLINKLKDNDFLNFGDARTKYLEFIRRYPTIATQVPQQYIASYLKITPQSLSRIRREIVTPKK